MSKLLALDQSSRVTGWSVFADGNLLEHGKFDASAVGTDHGKRLTFIQQKISALIEKYNIEHVVFEDIQLQSTVGNNVVTFKTLAYVQSAIIILLHDKKIPYTIVAPSTWRHTLGIKGRERAVQKKAAKEWVIAQYNIKASEDECDSICIGAHHIKTAPEEGHNWAD